MRTQVAVLPVTIGHNHILLRQFRKYGVDPLFKLRKGYIECALDVACFIKLKGPGIDENSPAAEELFSCFVERDEDVLTELQSDPRFRRPVTEERHRIGAKLVHDET